MGGSSEEAKKYLTRNEIPVLFESLMTGLMYNKPEDHVDFMIRALRVAQNDPDKKITWDAFVEPPPLEDRRVQLQRVEKLSEPDDGAVVPKTPKPSLMSTPSTGTVVLSNGQIIENSTIFDEANKTKVPDVPVILFMGGPGGLKTRYSQKVATEFESQNLVHMSMRKLIQDAIIKYRDEDELWQLAAERFDAGERIDDHLALALLKTNMAQHPKAEAFFLEGYPKDVQQISDFEKHVHEITIAIILDYDEETLRKEMRTKKMSESDIEARMHNFKTHTLPAAKHFDDKALLNLIPGEQPEAEIHEQLENLILRVLHPKEFGQPRKSSVAASLAQKQQRAAGQSNRNPTPLVLVIGAPGSQKVEFCKRLVKRYEKYVHVSMGELLRNYSGADSGKIREAMQIGKHAPAEICKSLIEKSLSENSSAWGLIVEGYPRTTQQAEQFETMVDKIDIAVLIDCTETFCQKTLKNRAEKNKSGLGKLRLDDDDAAIKKRLQLFKDSTLPMLKHFDEKGTLKVVEGDRGLDEIFEDLANVIDNALFVTTDSGSGKSLASSKNSTK